MEVRTGFFKRWMAMFLCLVMFVSMLPVGTAFADEGAENLETTEVQNTSPSTEPTTPVQEEVTTPSTEPTAPVQEEVSTPPSTEPSVSAQANEDDEVELDIALEMDTAKVSEKEAYANPVLVSVVKQGNGLKITWQPSAGAAKYRVFRRDNEAWKGIANTTANFYIDTGVSNGKTYKYTVRCVSADGKTFTSGYDSAGITGTYWNYATPNLTSIKCVDGGITVTWSSVGASQYRVYRIHDGVDSGWVSLATVNGTSYTDKQVVAGHKYTYTVRVIGNGYESAYKTAGISITYMGKTAVTKLDYEWDTTKNRGAIRVTWNGASGVSYRVYRKLASEPWGSTTTKTLVNVTGSSYLDSDVTSGNTYSYRVMAMNGNTILGSYDPDGKSVVFYETPELDPDPVITVNNGITINWKAVEGITNYRIYRKTDTIGWQVLGNCSTNTYTDTTAAAGTTYYYTVRCFGPNWSTCISGYDPNGVKANYTNTPILVKIEPEDTPVDGLRVTWKRVEGVSYYQIYRKADNTNWTFPTGGEVFTPADPNAAELSFVDPDAAKMVGMKLTYTVRALKSANKDDHYSSYDPNGISGVFYFPPTNLTAEATAKGIQLSWTNSVNAPKYQILRRATATGAFEVIATTTDTTYIDDDTSLSSGVTYYYEVVVLDNNNVVSSVPSNIANAVYYAPPKLVDIEVVTNGITFTWETEADITEYKVYRKSGNTNWTELTGVTPKASDDGKTYSITDTNVTSGTTYSYTVSCVKGGSEVSQYDRAGLTATFLGYESGLVAIKTLENRTEGIYLYWNPVDGVKQYGVFRREKDTQKEAYQLVSNVSTNSFIDTSIRDHNGAGFYYCIRPYSSTGSLLGDFSLEKFITRYVTPSMKSVKVRDILPTGNRGEIIVTWEPVDGISKYRLYRRTNNGGWTIISDVTGTTYTDTTAGGLRSGNTYTYTVRCMDGGSVVSYYDTNGLGTYFLHAPVLADCQLSGSTIQVYWQAVVGADNYRVYRKLPGGGWVRIAIVNGYSNNNYTDTEVLSGSTYIYTVRAHSNYHGAIGGYDSAGVTAVALNAPNISVANAFGGVSVTWGAVPNATGYEIRYQLNGGSWTSWTSVSGTSNLITGLTSGAQYNFQVRAVKGSMKGGISAVKSIIYYAAPANVKVSKIVKGSEYNSVTVTWSNVAGAVKYRVFRKAGNGSWVGLANTTGTSYTDTKAKVNTAYTYTVRCVNSAGNAFVSGYDPNPTNAKVAAAFNLSAPVLQTPSVAAGAVTIKWKAVSGAAKYRVFRKTLTGSWVGIGNSTGTSYVDRGAKAGTYYVYTVRCVSSDGSFFTSAYDTTGKTVLAK